MTTYIKHGVSTGHARHGCGKKGSPPCPATPSCRETYLAIRRARYAVVRAQSGELREGAQAHHVRIRITESLERVDLRTLAKMSRVTQKRIAEIRESTQKRIAWDEAGKLDRVWSYVVHGVDQRKVRHEHGTPRRYELFCRCEACTTASSNRRKRVKMNEVRPTSFAPEKVVNRVRAHIARLLTNPAITRTTIAQTANLSNSRVWVIYDRKQGCTYATAQAILSVTEEACMRTGSEHAMRPAEDVVAMIWKLRALGYPAKWIAEQAGLLRVTVSSIANNTKGRECVQKATAQAIARLYEDLSETPATPDATGLQQWVIDRARREAKAADWHEPWVYVNGVPDFRLLSGHPHAMLDDECAAFLRAAKEIARGELPVRAAEQQYGVWFKNSSHGLTFHSGKLDRTRSSDRITVIEDTLAAVEYTQMGVVEAVVTLGFRNLDNLARKIEIRDHPEVAMLLRQAEGNEPGRTRTEGSVGQIDADCTETDQAA